jgi:hypothetical protein
MAITELHPLSPALEYLTELTFKLLLDVEIRSLASRITTPLGCFMIPTRYIIRPHYYNRAHLCIGFNDDDPPITQSSIHQVVEGHRQDLSRVQAVAHP